MTPVSNYLEVIQNVGFELFIDMDMFYIALKCVTKQKQLLKHFKSIPSYRRDSFLMNLMKIL